MRVIGGVDMDDEGTRKGRRVGMGGDGMWGQAEKRLGVTLSCQLVLGANARVMQNRKERVEAEVRCERFWHRVLSRVDIVSFCEGCCRLGALDAFFDA